MAGTELSQQIRQGVEALRSEGGSEPTAGCGAKDLAGLLNTIVGQIAEADRRHTDTLQQLQERLEGIGREAKAIKPRVPHAFAGAFERIEAGMAELASRMAESNEDAAATFASVSPGQISPAPVAPACQREMPSFIDPPAALWSAADHVTAATRRREEQENRAQSGVDTFDVIESSLPGNASDPWDRDAAEALTNLYESGSLESALTTKGNERPPSDVRTIGSSLAAESTAMPGVDHNWLQTRFTEIAHSIDESLKDIRPDQGFFALGQRVDQLEQYFGGLLEGVATRGDISGLHLIEAHVGEIAGHLENAHHQLMRLDIIEEHLAGITSKLDDVQRAAEAVAAGHPGAAHFQSGIDIGAVARTAAAETASHFAQLPPQPSHDAGELRDMLSGFIAESRQDEENTSALLDTLQQAMIRLLDRVDAIEFNTLQAGYARNQLARQDYEPEHGQFNAGSSHVQKSPHIPLERGEALDAAVAAVASAKAVTSPYGHAPEAFDVPAQINDLYSAKNVQAGGRSPEKLRQDFIADARRAKMRLAAESEGDSEIASAGRFGAEAAADVTEAKQQVRDAKPASKTAAITAKSAPSSLLTPNIRVMALATLLALGGGWCAMEYFQGQKGSVAIATDPNHPPVPAASLLAGAAPKSNLEAPGMANSESVVLPDATAPGTSTMPAKNNALQLEHRQDTRGEIVPDDLTVGSTNVPLYGVAVDSEKTMTVDQVSRARRQQAMAAVSTQLGQAALQNPDALAIPASLTPENTAAAASKTSDGEQTSITKSGMSKSMALDLPPATVGPLSLRLAAANGDPSAEFEVGARLAEGKGTNQNFTDAAKWYQRSASQGFAQAQYRLGTLYERGLGVKADTARAADWYKRSAEQGNIKAMHNLAVLSANQSKGSPDYATAAQWFQNAAEHGLSDSQFNLAVLHENGLGVTQDLVIAYKWLSLAAKSGDKEALRRRDILRGKLTAEQLAKAEALIAAWKPKIVDQQINDPRKAGESWKTNPGNDVSG